MPKNNPVVILVRPQMGENIGAVARAMNNFGLSELRLVAPRDGWPNPAATAMASGGEHILEAAKLYPDFGSATADIQIAYATTARKRDMEKRVITPDAACGEISAQSTKAALVFGPERTGLENDEVTWCDTLITIPTAEKASLNLAQSVVILGYEWWKTQASIILPKDDNLAPLAEYQGMFEQLEGYLDTADYFRVPQKKPLMWQNLKTMLLRARFNEQEIRTFRGALRALWERRIGG